MLARRRFFCYADVCQETCAQNLDRIDTYLSLWAAWMRGKDTNLGYPKHAAPHRLHRSRIQHFDDLAEECDTAAVRTVDALIDSLEPYQYNAIHVYHLGASWRFPGIPLDECYLDARVNVLAGLNRWGLP